MSQENSLGRIYSSSSQLLTACERRDSGSDAWAAPKRAPKPVCADAQGLCGRNWRLFPPSSHLIEIVNFKNIFIGSSIHVNSAATVAL